MHLCHQAAAHRAMPAASRQWACEGGLLESRQSNVARWEKGTCRCYSSRRLHANLSPRFCRSYSIAVRCQAPQERTVCSGWIYSLHGHTYSMMTSLCAAYQLSTGAALCDLTVCVAQRMIKGHHRVTANRKIDQRTIPYSGPLTSLGNSSSESEPSVVVLAAVGIVVASSEAAGATFRLFTFCIPF